MNNMNDNDNPKSEIIFLNYLLRDEQKTIVYKKWIDKSASIGKLVSFGQKIQINAAVAELADAQASGACFLREVEVRLLSAA